MRKLFSIAFLLFVFVEITSGHDQEVHQFIIRKAYQLLVTDLGYAIPKLSEKLGDTENGDAAFIPGGKIVIGAWQEDNTDVVYGNEGIFLDCNVSATHFWHADAGDASTFATSSGESFPNAYQKALKYMYGGYRLRIPYAGSSIIEEYDAPSNLMQFYKDGIIYYRGYFQIDGQFVTRGYWHVASQEMRDKVVFEIIGRIAHLLADMSVPAHVHNDEHAPIISGLDSYEEAFADNFHDWDVFFNYTNMAAQKGGPIYVNSASNPLKYLFYTTNQITDYFPSDDKGGDYSNESNDNFATYPELLATGTSMRTAIPQQPTSVRYQDINEWALTTGIRATAGLLYWFAKEADILPIPWIPSVTITPTTNNVGTIKGLTEIHSSLTIENTGNVYFSGNIKTTNYNYDLDYINTPTVYENQINFSLDAGQSKTINYRGCVPAYYGPFTEVLNITTSIGNITHTIVGSIALPDFCYGETQAMAASPEELLFDKAFVDFYVADTIQVETKNGKKREKKSIKERLDFAYNLLKKDKTEKVENICQEIIELYPESEMGISFYAMGLLWEAAYSDLEAPDFTEKDFNKFLKKLTEKKDKFKINGYAQLILSLLDVGNDIEGLEKLFSDYEYDGLKELALFHQFIHYYIYKQDNEIARKVSDQLDKMFVDSKYGYQAHLIFGDEGYTLEGLKELLKKKQESLLAKRGESKNDILSEMPKEYKLYNNYPNPFNPSTTIKYSVPKVSNVKLQVYNMMGQLIKTLVNETKAPGFYNILWSGTNENNSKVASGIYFYRFESENFIANNKMILIK